ncbi:MAG: fibrobacter succinogenes major paralogous domain-containing protein [Alistipes sp.]|nr:fibrobacter succinogenes major paralogous domain-containing protein [Alistipes sp.]
MLFRPATGYRHVTTGALTNVGANGNYWSSSSYSAGNNAAGDLNFNSSNVNPLNNPNRANGLSVRCVQHLRGAVLSFYETLQRHFFPDSLRTRNGAGHGSRQCGP